MSRVGFPRVVFFIALIFGLTVGVVSPSPAFAGAPTAAATGTILDQGAADAVPGQYIVALQASAITGTATVASVAQSLTASYGGTVGDVLDGFQMFVLNSTDAIASAIAGDSRVSYVDQDQYDQAAATPSVPPVQDNPGWALARINQRVANLGSDTQYASGSSAGVSIYVVDSGVNTLHPDMAGRATNVFDATTNTSANLPANNDCAVDPGHGTSVAAAAAGTTYGAAKQALIKSVKVFTCDSTGQPVQGPGAVTDDGLNWILNNAPIHSVVNLSLGNPGLNASRAAIVNQLTTKGFTVVMAAGNQGINACDATPGSKTKGGAALNAIVVGATGLDKTTNPPTDIMWSLSNYGPCVTLFAPGQSVPTAFSQSTGTRTAFGTSIASGYVSGAAAIVLAANPSFYQEDVQNALLNDATTPATNGVSTLITGAATSNPPSPDKLLYVPPPPSPYQATVNGPAVSQAVGSSAPTYDFSFAGTAGQVVEVNGTAGAFNTGVTLVDPMGTQLGSGSAASYESGQAENWISPVDLPLTGTYSIHVTPTAGASGTVSVQVLTAVAVTATVNGAAVSATIPTATPGRQVVATFSGTVGQTVLVNGTAGGYNAAVSLVDSHGAQMATGQHWSYNSGTAEQWISPINLPYTGTYTLLISPDAKATGSVSLQVLASGSAVVATVGGAAVSTTIPATTPGQRLTVTFAGTVGQTVYVNGTSGAFNAAISLADPHGAQIATGQHWSYNSGTAEQWISPINLPYTGTYTIYVSPTAGATGAVGLQVLKYATASATVGGAAASATIPAASPGQRLAVTFAGTAGQTIYVNGTAGGYNAAVSLVDPRGGQMATGQHWSYDPGIAEQWISPVNLPYTGTYTLYISPDASATGTVSLQVIGSYVTASAGVNGLPVALTIPTSTPGKIMAVTLSGTAGSTISVEGITGAVGGSLSMYDPQGALAATGTAIPLYPCPGDEVPGTCPQVLIAPVTIPLTGTYTILFTPAAIDVGTVTLTVTGVSGTTSAPTIIKASAAVDGAAVPVTVPTAAANQRVALTFSGTAGQAVYLNSNCGSSCGSLNTTYSYVSLIGPTGQLVVPSGGGLDPGTGLTLLDPTGLPATGTYTLYITLASTLSGTLDLQLLSKPVAVSATVGGAVVPVTVASTAVGQRVAVTFSGTAGQAVYVNSNCSGSSCSSLNTTYSYVSLVGPSGQVVVPSGAGLDVGGPTTLLAPTGLPATGTYTLYVATPPNLYGTMNLQVLSQPVAASATVGGAVVPVTVPSTAVGQRVAVTFSGTAGQAVYVNSNCSGSSCSSLNTTYSYVSLVGPSGQVVVPSGGGLDVGGPTTLLAPTGLPATGTYTLYVTTPPNLYGTMNLQVLSQPVAVSATVGGAVVPVTVASTAVGQRVAVTFSGTAGQAVYVNSNCSGSSCSSLNTTYSYVSLVGPSGQVVVPSGAGLDVGGPTTLLAPTGLPATGTYTLYVTTPPNLYGTMNLQAYSYS
ncbi:hypothetical protein ABH935_004935 [Catenulispora sp. GAS73]|uniref:S8 family serine peptidase n=1 Tax=Catenulispora sp. GAS73 TaxID=3156269 RepID=UPI00351616CA